MRHPPDCARLKNTLGNPFIIRILARIDGTPLYRRSLQPFPRLQYHPKLLRLQTCSACRIHHRSTLARLEVLGGTHRFPQSGRGRMPQMRQAGENSPGLQQLLPPEACCCVSHRIQFCFQSINGKGRVAPFSSLADIPVLAAPVPRRTSLSNVPASRPWSGEMLQAVAGLEEDQPNSTFSDLPYYDRFAQNSPMS